MTSISLKILSEELWEDLGGEVLSVTSQSDYGLKIIFKCDDWAGSRNIRKFKIICHQVADSTVVPIHSGEIAFETEHELLWKHNLPHFNLYYNSIPTNPYECLGMLWKVHCEAFEYIACISNFIDPQNFMKYNSGGLGLLARGPEPQVRKYQEAILGHVDTYMIPSYQPKGGCKVLLFDHGYVIAQDFQIEEIFEELKT